MHIQLDKNFEFLAPFKMDGMTRIGIHGDGGYVLPVSIIEKCDALVSLGVSCDWSFDEHFTKLNPEVFVHGYDYSISGDLFKKSAIKGVLKFLLFLGSIRELKERFNLYRRYINFFSGKNIHYEERVFNRNFEDFDVTIGQIFKRIGPKNCFLKVDIEGGEYRIIDDILIHSPYILGMAFEFHDTDPYRMLFIESVHKIQEHYKIVHLHINNSTGIASDGLPETLEITFVKNEFCSSKEIKCELPIEGLDFKNDLKKIDYKLSFQQNEDMESTKS